MGVGPAWRAGGGPGACCHRLPAFHLHRGSPNRASKSALKLTLNCLQLFPTICSVLYGLAGREDGCEA